jgi:hypothetical protein
VLLENQRTIMPLKVDLDYLKDVNNKTIEWEKVLTTHENGIRIYIKAKEGLVNSDKAGLL